jgi:small GTP-binding protein
MAAHALDRARSEFRVVVLGTGPVGKTSLVNALLRRAVGETGATSGTTRAGQAHTHRIDGVEGTLLLTDTPGLGEAGAGGRAHELEAIELATGADLVLYLLDHDLTRSDCEVISALGQQGKRLLIALNKKDRFAEADRLAVMDKLRERLRDSVAAEDVVSVAAAPSPIQLRVRKPDGSTETVLETELPDLEELERRVESVLAHEGDALRAGNLLLRGRLKEQAEREALRLERRAEAEAVIERHQWLAAMTAFANPVLALGPMAVGAVQLRMLSELAAVYDAELSPDFVKLVGRRMTQALLKLGAAEMAASVLGGLLKINPLGFAAGGLVQAVAMAYLTRLSGDSFVEYLEDGGDWAEDGMQKALARQLQESRRSEWLVQFAKLAIERLRRR